jgi:catechol 2,3-dioxygenase-like lactoylglutathione lyase family enzyme
VLDHLALTVSDTSGARSFYERALEPLGFSVQLDYGERVGFGRDGMPSFWLYPGERSSGPVHVAFQAADRAAVDAFHAAALAAGGEDNGAPGLRPKYHPNYYAAFVYDADGNNVEAVSHRAE